MTHDARRSKYDIGWRGRSLFRSQIQIKWLRLKVGAAEIIFGEQQCSIQMLVLVNLFHVFVVANTASAGIVHRIFDYSFRNRHFDAIVDTVVVFGTTAVGGLHHRLILKMDLLQNLKRFGRQQRLIGQIRC